jgi:hypothetical protein
MILIELLCVIVVLGMFLLVYGTVVKNRWGINLGPVVCANCKSPIPFLRNPQTVKQALWGGGTCASCHYELDKWGRKVSDTPGAPSPEANAAVNRKVVWGACAVGLAPSIWFDLYHPVGFIFDLILLIFLPLWLPKLGKAAQKKN